ncbi:MAG: hypothetical protein IT458_02095 [Planctomycetes bacterium]|nr:hypothetical protein [Planctomycetota bacterium]
MNRLASTAPAVLALTGSLLAQVWPYQGYQGYQGYPGYPYPMGPSSILRAQTQDPRAAAPMFPTAPGMGGASPYGFQREGVPSPNFAPGFPGQRSLYPLFPTAPRTPAETPGYGAYPGVGAGAGQAQPGPGIPGRQPLPRADLTQDLWPAWMEFPEGMGPTKRTPEQGLLVRTGERVWFLDPDEPAFVPLPFFEKMRIVRKGTVVEVRQRGEFLCWFHDDARLRSSGPARLSVVDLDASAATLRLESLTRVMLATRVRPLRVTLPDGALLETTPGHVDLVAEEGIGRVMNHGPGTVRYTGSMGSVDIPRGTRLAFFLTGAEEVLPGAALEVRGSVTQQRKGRTLEVEGGAEGGTVTWSGAQFSLRQGARLRLDPLGGREFPDHKAAASRPSGTPTTK